MHFIIIIIFEVHHSRFMSFASQIVLFVHFTTPLIFEVCCCKILQIMIYHLRVVHLTTPSILCEIFHLIMLQLTM
jgi:hypothetical protein